MGMQVEFNWFIVAKDRKDVIAKSSIELRLTKEGRRLYPVGEEFSLPVIVDGKCLGVANVKHLEMTSTHTTINFEMVQVFEKNDAIAAYYEKSYANYKTQQERLNTGGKQNLTSKFLDRLHGKDEING